MSLSVDLVLAAVAFVASVCVLIGIGLFVLTVVLRMQARHRKRLARVGRRRMSGRLDLEDVRQSLVRQKKERNAAGHDDRAPGALRAAARHDAAARQHPAAPACSCRSAAFMLISLASPRSLTVGGACASGKPVVAAGRARAFLRHGAHRPRGAVSGQHARQAVHEAAARRDRHHHPRHPLGRAGDRVHRHRRAGVRRAGRRPLPQHQRAGGARRAARGGALAHRAGDRQAGDGLSRHRHRHPDGDRRQPVGGAVQPRRPPAQPPAHEAEDQGDLVGGAGERDDHRRPALPDARPLDDDEPGLRDAALHRSARPDDARRRPDQHLHGRVRDVAHDPVRD